MRVSVVIPAYRAAGTIGRAIDSIVAQTHPAHEVLVVDDGSPDDLPTAVAPYWDRATLLRKPNGGAASARNLGIEHASGDLIAFLDADDYWEPQKLEKHVELYERYPQLGLTCGRYFNQPPGGERQEQPLVPGIAYDQLLKPDGPDAFELGTRVWTGTVVVRRSILADMRFVSGLEPAEDRHLWVRLVSAAPMIFLSEPLATAVLEEGSLSRSSVDRDCANMLRVVQSYRELLGWTASRRWQSHTLYRWAACDGVPLTALRRLLHSFVLWPLPYRRIDVRMPFARPKLFAVTVRRVLHQSVRAGAPAERPAGS